MVDEVFMVVGRVAQFFVFIITRRRRWFIGVVVDRRDQLPAFPQHLIEVVVASLSVLLLAVVTSSEAVDKLDVENRLVTAVGNYFY